MPRQLPLAKYGPNYARTIRLAHSTRILSIACASPEEAEKLRRRLYNYRAALRDEASATPLAKQARELRFTLDGPYLEIRHRDETTSQYHDILEETSND